MNGMETTTSGEHVTADSGAGPLWLWPRLGRHLENATTSAAEYESDSSAESDPVTVHSTTRWIGITGLTLTAIGVAVSLGSAFFLHRFRDHQIISVGQPPFLYLVCFGVLLLSISVSLNTTLGDDVSGRTKASLDASCIAWVWCTSVGELVIYLALLCKLWRVEKVARFRKGQKILAKHVLGPFAGVILAAIGILVVWTVVSPPHYQREIVEAGDGTLHSIGVCHYDDGGIFQLVLSILFLVTVAVVFWLSLRTRHLPESLSDSRRITQTLLAHLLLGLAMLVIKVIAVVVSASGGVFRETGDESALRASFFLTKVFYQFAVGMLTLGFLVLPKIYCVRYERVHGNLPQGVRKLVEGRVTVTMNNERLVEVDGRWTSEGASAAQRWGGGSIPQNTATTATAATPTRTKRSAKIPLLWSRRSDRTTEASTVDTRTERTGTEGGSGRGAPNPKQNKGGCITDGGDDGIVGGGPAQSQSQSQSQSQRSDHIPDARNEFCDVEGGSQEFVMEAESSKSSANENGDGSSADGVEH